MKELESYGQSLAEQGTSDAVPIKKGVREGCILSRLLVYIYSEAIFYEALTEKLEG